MNEPECVPGPLPAIAINKKIAEMKAADKIIELTPEEERLLRSFRRFKMTCKKAGVIFKWQTRPLDQEIVIVSGDAQALIIDPQEEESLLVSA